MDATAMVGPEPMWATITKGILLTLFGLVALAWPGVTLVSLIWLIAVYIIVAGIADMVSGVMHVGKSYWWAKLLVGVAELGVGVYLIRHTAATLTVFLLVIGFFFLIRGFTEVIMMFFPGIESPGRLILGFVGILSIVLGFYLLRYPISSSLAFVWVLGLYALIAGPLNVATAITHSHSR